MLIFQVRYRRVNGMALVAIVRAWHVHRWAGEVDQEGIACENMRVIGKVGEECGGDDRKTGPEPDGRTCTARAFSTRRCLNVHPIA